jgi:hypothetical protein
MSFWKASSKNVNSALEQEKQSTRLDCFLSVLYLFPNCLDVEDTDLLVQRERELNKIHRYAGQGFLASYCVGCFGHFIFRKGHFPYFRQFTMHTILAIGGTFMFAFLAEKIAAEMVYNRVLIDMSNKYNFTPEEVNDLQRNLNQYYIKKEREEEMSRH